MLDIQICSRNWREKIFQELTEVKKNIKKAFPDMDRSCLLPQPKFTLVSYRTIQLLDEAHRRFGLKSECLLKKKKKNFVDC